MREGRKEESKEKREKRRRGMERRIKGGKNERKR